MGDLPLSLSLHTVGKTFCCHAPNFLFLFLGKLPWWWQRTWRIIRSWSTQIPIEMLIAPKVLHQLRQLWLYPVIFTCNLIEFAKQSMRLLPHFQVASKRTHQLHHGRNLWKTTEILRPIREQCPADVIYGANEARDQWLGIHNSCTQPTTHPIYCTSWRFAATALRSWAAATDSCCAVAVWPSLRVWT